MKWLTSKVAVATFGSVKASREMKRTSVLALIVAFLLLIGPLTANVVDGQANPPRQPSRVFGTVTIGGVVASGVTVTAKVGSISIKSTTTASNGYYGFNVPADNLDTGAKDGAEPDEVVSLLIGGADGYDPGVSFTFAIGGTPSAKNLSAPASARLNLSVLLQATGTAGQAQLLSGTVVDANGGAVDSATVTINWGDGQSETTSTSGGAFSVAHIFLSLIHISEPTRPY